MSSDAPTAAPSAAPVSAEPVAIPATDQAVASNDVAAYREARRAERSGKPLPTTPASSAPSTEGEVKPASEPGKPRKTAEDRIPELLADRAAERQAREAAERRARELEERLAQRTPAPTPDGKPAGSSPAPVQAPANDPNDPEPTLEDFEKDPDKYPDPYTAHQRALARWEARQEFRQLKAAEQQRVEHETRQKAVNERFGTFKETVAKAGGKPFLESLSAEVRELRPFDSLEPGEEPTGLNAVAQRFLDCDPVVAPLLMKHFSDHPEELQRFGKLDPSRFFLEMGRLEAKLQAGKAAPTPPIKQVTSAPAPPTTVTTRPTEPGDEIEAAVANDDVRGYRAARLRQRIAALNG